MDLDIEVAASETPEFDLTKDIDDPTDYEAKSLETYLSSVPYPCESNEVIQEKLKWVVGRLVTALKSRDWMSVNVYDHLLQW